MRHRRKGRVLGRAPSHQRALLRNLASALVLTERDAEFDDNKPKVQGPHYHDASEGERSSPVGREVHHDCLPQPSSAAGGQRICHDRGTQLGRMAHLRKSDR